MADIDVSTTSAWIYCNMSMCIGISLVAAIVVFVIGKYGLPMMGITKNGNGNGKGPMIAGGLTAVIGVGTTLYFQYVADKPGAAGDTCPK